MSKRLMQPLLPTIANGRKKAIRLPKRNIVPNGTPPQCFRCGDIPTKTCLDFQTEVKVILILPLKNVYQIS